MKKTILFLVAAVMAIALVGCNVSGAPRHMTRGGRVIPYTYNDGMYGNRAYGDRRNYDNPEAYNGRVYNGGYVNGNGGYAAGADGYTRGRGAAPRARTYTEMPRLANPADGAFYQSHPPKAS